MITLDLLNQNDLLKGLDDSVKAKIVELSTNDENQVIAAQRKAFWDKLDLDIKALTGEEKPTTLKTHEWLKKSFETLKTKAEKAGNVEALNTKIKTLEDTNTALQKQIEEGSTDEALKTQIANLQNEHKNALSKIKSWEDKHSKDIADLKGQLESEQNKNVSLELNNELEKGLQGIVFKDEKIIPLAVRQREVEAAKQLILKTYHPKFEIVDGKKHLFYHDENGLRLNNPDNSLQPFTSNDLLIKHLEPVIDKGKSQLGIGSKPGDKTTSVVGINATTKTDFLKQVDKVLTDKGLAKGTGEFQEERNKILTENAEAYSALPMQ